VLDTAQIDLQDGKLCVRMLDLNSAGRRAIRNGDVRASLQEYTFHHLKHSGNTNTVVAASTSASAPAA
jgi:hypothetical protein